MSWLSEVRALSGSGVWLNGCRAPGREIVPLGVGIRLLQLTEGPLINGIIWVGSVRFDTHSR